jgi:hypothetical protein
MKDVPMENSMYGFKLPRGIKMSAVKNTRIFSDQFEEQGQYISKRTAQLSVGLEISPKLFHLKTRGGFVMNGNQSGSFKSMETSVLYEKRFFRLEINELTQLEISDHFCEAVRSARLPATYDKNDIQNRSAFEDFFNTWGHFIISSAFGGGSVEMKSKFSGSNMSSEALQQAIFELEAKFKIVTTGISATVDGSSGTGQSSVFSTNQLVWEGGNIQCQVPTMEQVTPDIWHQWETSLASQPSILMTEMTLLPICEVVDRVDNNKFQSCRDAMVDFLGGKFIALKNEEEEQKRRKIEEENRKRIEKEKEETSNANIANSVKPKKKKWYQCSIQ